MARRTNSELQEALDDISETKGILQEAYTPEASRETMAGAIKDALDQLEDYEGPEKEEQDEGEED